MDEALGLHVEDFIWRSNGVSSERDTSNENRGSDFLVSFMIRVQSLSLCKRFQFGSSTFGMEFVYCGGQVVQSFNLVAIDVRQESTREIEMRTRQRHFESVRQDTVSFAGRCDPLAICTEHDFASATVLFLQAGQEHPVVDDLLEADRV